MYSQQAGGSSGQEQGSTVLLMCNQHRVDPQTVVREGFLSKRSNKAGLLGRVAWKQRYFLLCRTYLAIYKRKEYREAELEPLFKAKLKHIREVAHITDKEMNKLKIEFKSSVLEHDLVLRGESREEALHWLVDIEVGRPSHSSS